METMSDKALMGASAADDASLIVLDYDIEAGGWPAADMLEALALRAVEAAADGAGRKVRPGSTVSLLFTDDARIRALNAQWRGKDKATNVLSFPSAAPATAVQPAQLGDIVLAYDTVAREAETEGKPFEHHLTHLIVHGFLHLLGYDHETAEEAEAMEALERKVLQGLAIADPYA